VGGEAVVEPPTSELTEETAAEHGRAVLPLIDRSISMLATLQDQALRAGEVPLRARFTALGDVLDSKIREFGTDADHLLTERVPQGVGRIVVLHGALLAAKTALTGGGLLDTFRSADSPIGYVDAGVQTLQSVLELSASAVAISSTVGAALARGAGEYKIAARFTTIGARRFFKVGTALAAVEATHGLVLLLRGKGEGMAKLGPAGAYLGAHGAARMLTRQAAVKAAASGAASGAGGAAIASAAAALKFAAGPGSALGALGAYELMASPAAYGKVAGDLAVGGLRPRLERLGGWADRIQVRRQRLAKATRLAAAERDPAERVALEEVVREAARDLSATVSSMLAECARPEAIDQAAPGGNPHLRRYLAPLQPLRGVTKDPQVALARADACLKAIGEVFASAASFASRSMSAAETRAAAEAAP
jgi:hypothetical protein